MVERTDERTTGSDAGDADLDELLDDDVGGTASGGDVGLSDDDLGVDVDALTGEPGASETADAGAGGETSRRSSGPGRSVLSRLRPSIGIPTPSGLLPSGRSVLGTFLLVLASTFAVSAIPLIGSLGGILGVFAATFLLGALSGKRRYLESGIAGSAVAGLSMVLGAMGQLFQFAVLTDTGLAPFALIGVTTGFIAAMLGHYFGRDFRSGLTRNVE